MTEKEIIIAVGLIFTILIINAVTGNQLFKEHIIEGHTETSCTLSDDIVSQVVSINNQIQEIRGRLSDYELKADAQAFFTKVDANAETIDSLKTGCKNMKESCEEKE